MHWSSWSEFFHMGGYGVYVWTSYAVTFVLLAIEVLMVIKRKRAIARTTIISEGRVENRKPKFETV